MLAFLDEKIPAAARRRALSSFVPLFEGVMALRCTPHLSHLGEQSPCPLNSACYMWWDLLRFSLWQKSTNLNAEIIGTLARLLAIPHDACRESALHGIGHFAADHPEYKKQLSAIVGEFRANTPQLRPELIVYSERARRGELL
jgi:hypothetical protein